MKKNIIILFIAIMIGTTVSGQSKADSVKAILLDSNIVAQTKNQLAQAEYYSGLKNSKNNEWVPVLGVLVAGLIGFLSAVLVSIRTIKSEKTKMLDIQRKEHMTATRLAASNLVAKVAEGVHSLTWILWIAKHNPQAFTAERVQIHDKGMNHLYSEIVGAQVNLAAYSKNLYEGTIEVVDKLYKYDARVAKLAPGLYNTTTKSKTTSELGSLWQEVYIFSLDIPGEFSAKLEKVIPMI